MCINKLGKCEQFKRRAIKKDTYTVLLNIILSKNNTRLHKHVLINSIHYLIDITYSILILGYKMVYMYDMNGMFSMYTVYVVCTICILCMVCIHMVFMVFIYG